MAPNSVMKTETVKLRSKVGLLRNLLKRRQSKKSKESTSMPPQEPPQETTDTTVPADGDSRDSEECSRNGLSSYMVQREGVDQGDVEEIEFVAIDNSSDLAAQLSQADEEVPSEKSSIVGVHDNEVCTTKEEVTPQTTHPEHAPLENGSIYEASSSSTLPTKIEQEVTTRITGPNQGTGIDSIPKNDSMNKLESKICSLIDGCPACDDISDDGTQTFCDDYSLLNTFSDDTRTPRPYTLRTFTNDDTIVSTGTYGDDSLQTFSAVSDESTAHEVVEGFLASPVVNNGLHTPPRKAAPAPSTFTSFMAQMTSYEDSLLDWIHCGQETSKPVLPELNMK